MKYKKCHLGREEESRVPMSETLALYRKNFGKETCLCPEQLRSECKGGIVKAHTISKRRALNDIAVDGHVMTIDASIPTLKQNNGIIGVRSMGINKASTFSGFCAHHDSRLFKSIDDADFSGDEEQYHLLAYRTIAREHYTKLAAHHVNDGLRSHDRGHPLDHQMSLQAFVNTWDQGTSLGLREIARHKSNYDESLVSSEFDRVRYMYVTLSGIPDIMFSGALYPECDFRGRRLQNLADLEAELEVIACNLISSNGHGYFVMTWLDEGNSVCSDFADSLRSMDRDGIPNAITRFAFEFCENTFWSPHWWQSLPQTQRDALLSRISSGVDPTVERLPNCLLDDGISYVDWNVVSIDHNY